MTRCPALGHAHRHAPAPVALHIEGGNLLSDGAGTLFTTERTLAANPYHTRQTLEALLRETLGCERLHVLSRLPVENTGHVDLLVKPVATDRLLISAPNGWDGGSLRALRRQLERASNAQGQPYTLIDLPTPRPYVNWLLWPIFRSYTNALLCNGRALVPVYGLPSDEAALLTYEQALPGYTVLPIDLRLGINGGGAVHCMTREVPALGE
ncbi:agmatine deiminase family protein [bacterium]|nr:agmatine deiminase family protein [bacterium]